MKNPISSNIPIQKLNDAYKSSGPFDHIVIDDFFEPAVAEALSSEFPGFNDDVWYKYENAIENKRALNSWDRFPKETYSVFSYLNSPQFIEFLTATTGIKGLVPDVGLHGGGWHAHARGGKLNVHLDYAIHPKLKLERRLNLIVYLTKNWDPSWGGGLELWDHDPIGKKPKSRQVSIENKFNRAVLFDTTQNSWHGLPDPINCPDGVVRKSIAIYYLTEPRANLEDERPKALFAPHGEQANDQAVLALIKQRSGLSTAQDVYRGPKKS